MTLDEAIKHCTRIVDECMKEMEKVPECHHDCYAPYVRTKARATEYAHYAEWLGELKYYRETIPEVFKIRSEWKYEVRNARRYRVCPFCTAEYEYDNRDWHFCPECGNNLNRG